MSFNIKRGLMMGSIAYLSTILGMILVAAIIDLMFWEIYFLQSIVQGFSFMMRFALIIAIAFFIAGGFIKDDNEDELKKELNERAELEKQLNDALILKRMKRK